MSEEEEEEVKKDEVKEEDHISSILFVAMRYWYGLEILRPSLFKFV